MKKFSFRLQRVLDVKNTVEDVKRRNFLAAESQHRKKTRELSEMYETLERYRLKLAEMQKADEVTRQVLNLYYNYFNSLAWRIEKQKGLIRLAKKEMEKRRGELLEAVKDRKILEQLKEKKHQAYMKEAEYEEQKHLDEVSGNKYFTQDAEDVEYQTDLAL